MQTSDAKEHQIYSVISRVPGTSKHLPHRERLSLPAAQLSFFVFIPVRRRICKRIIVTPYLFFSQLKRKRYDSIDKRSSQSLISLMILLMSTDVDVKSRGMRNARCGVSSVLYVRQDGTLPSSSGCKIHATS